MIVLQPGIQAPEFSLPAANQEEPVSLADYRDRVVILVFFPAAPGPEVIDQLVKFGQNPLLADQGAALLSISPALPAELQKLAAAQDLKFPVLSDVSPPAATAIKYGATAENGAVVSTVFVLDEEGLIRRVYEAGQYPGLPNPAMVARAVKKLADTVKAPPITPDDWQLGAPEAPVSIIEYADYQCTPCGEAYRLLRQIVPLYGPDNIRWVHRHLPLRHSHPLAQQAAEAAEAAGAQGKFWEMHDRLFEARGALEPEQLLRYAAEIGLDVDRFGQDLDSDRFKDAVNEDFKLAVRNKIKLPPALFINRLPLEGPRNKEVICTMIDQLLACTAKD